MEMVEELTRRTIFPQKIKKRNIQSELYAQSEKPLHGAKQTLPLSLKGVLNDWFNSCLTGRKQITEFGPKN